MKAWSSCGIVRSHPGITLIATAYLALAVFYGLVTPIFEAPDELWHYLVIRQIVDHRVLPVQVKPTEESLSRQESSQPPLYYLIASPFIAPRLLSGGPGIARLDDVALLNPNGQPGNTQALENRNIVFHTPSEDFPYSGIALQIHLLRLVSIAMGLVTVVATYALALDLATGWHRHPRALALGAAALNAANPQFLFITASVNNDNLATALSSLTLLAMVRFYRRAVQDGPSETLPPPVAGLEIKHWAWLGLLIGANSITKLSTLALLPLVIATMLVSFPRKQWRSAIRPFLWFFGTLGLVAGWWYLRNLWLYGDVTGLSAMMDWLGQRTEPYSWSEVRPDLAHLWATSWALFGWSNIPADKWVYWLFGALAGFSVLGWLVTFARRRSAPKLARFGFAIIVSYLVLLVVSLVRYHLLTVAAEGRLLFPAISGACILLFFGIAFLVPARYTRRLTLFLVPVLLAVAAFVPPRYIVPAYAAPTSQAAGWPPAVVSEVHTNYGDLVELVAFGADQEELQTAKTARFTFQWKSLRNMDRSYKFFVHVLDENGKRVGHIDAFPGKGVYPIRLWPLGRPFFETYEIPISFDAAPGPAAVFAGLYDADVRNLPARDPNGADLGDTPKVGVLKIVAPDRGDAR